MAAKFEREVLERLTKIESDLKSIHTDLKEDYKILHGNGKPGLIDRLTLMEQNWAWVKWLFGIVGGIAGIVLSLVLKRFI